MITLKNIYVPRWIAAIFFLTVSIALHAAAPTTINYQGFLTDSSGVAIDGSHSITFKLYTALTGGSELWTSTKTITVTKGIYSTVLGDSVALTGLDFDVPYYLGLTIASDAEMSPRQALAASAYAIQAKKTEKIGTLTTNKWCSSDGTTISCTENAPTGSGDLLSSNNLSDLESSTTARTNLGLGSVATLSAIGSTQITDATITNADISASAAIADNKLATISTASKVSNSATTATDANTNSAIVARDGSGNFAAGTITANLTGNVAGNASTATALFADGANCSTGQYPLGVDASGAVQNCTTATGGADLTGTETITGNWVNTSNPWADNEVAENLTLSGATVNNSIIGASTPAVATFTTVTANANVSVKNGSTSAGQLEIFENSSDGSDKLILQAPALTADYTLTLPVDDGTSGQILSTDGSGVLSWLAAGSGDLLSSNNLSELTGSAGTARTNLGLGSVATLSAISTTEITDATITDTDISALAAIADSKLATISTANKVANSATTATDANTASAIVARDSNGNFSAGTITATLTGDVTGALSGNASTATALATDGADCPSGQYPLGVDASGAVQNCTAAGGSSGYETVSATGTGAVTAICASGSVLFGGCAATTLDNAASISRAEDGSGVITGTDTPDRWFCHFRDAFNGGDVAGTTYVTCR